MKVKVRKILLCVFFALFIVTLFTASFSLGRYSSVQSSESDYDDDFEYTLYDSIVVNTIDEFFAAISNGYNYIIIGDAIKDPLIIAGSMSDIRDDLIIDLNGHEIQRNSRDPLLNVTTGFTLTIIDSERTGSMYNPVGSVIQVSGGTLTVQNGIFESGPRSDNSRDAKRHNDENEPDYVDVTAYNEYATGSNESGWNALGGGSIRDTDTVTVYRNSNIGKGSTSNTYGDSIGTVALPIITPKATGRGVVNGSMYFDDAEEERIYYTCNEYNVIKDDTYLYYTFESDNMQYSEAADKSTANYYYQYYVAGGELEDTQESVNSYFTYAGYEGDGSTHDNNILVTVYVFNDVKYYAAEQSGYTDSSGTPGFAAVKMQSGNLYVRGGTYYSYFGEENTFGVQSTGGLMTVNPTGSNAINFYAYQNGVCVECTVDEPTENEMLNISSGKFYSELGDTVRVKNGNLVIGTADFTKDVGSYSGETTTTWGRNGSVIDISGGTLTINNSADFDITGSYINGIYSHGAANSSVNVTGATFNFNTAGNNVHNCAINAGAGTVECYGTTKITFGTDSSKAERNLGIYSAGGTIDCYGNTQISINGSGAGSGHNYAIYTTSGAIKCGIPQTTNEATGLDIDIATAGASDYNYGIYSTGGGITAYGETDITIGTTGAQTTDSLGIYSAGGDISLGSTYNQGNGSVVSRIGQTTIAVNGDSSSDSNFGIEAAGGTVDAENATINVCGASSAGIYTSGTDPQLNITGSFACTVTQDEANTCYSAAIMATSGSVTFKTDNGTINTNGVGIVVRGGTLTQNSGSLTVNNWIENTYGGQTYGGTGIYIANGNFTQAAKSELTVNSEIDGIYWGSFIAGNTVTEQTQTTNGIYITGGSLTANGTLNVTHTGKGNASYSGTDYAFLQQQITSYAVRVQGTTSTFVTINAGKITNSIGGGVYVSGGTVTLGSQASNVGPTVTTTGQSVFFAQAVVNDSWDYSQSQTGGHAVEVSGGNLTVNGGSYTAAHGNGILVRNTGDSQNEVTINNGTFIGNTVTTSGSGTVGPGVSYGLNIMGKNLTVTINGGNFGEKDNTDRVNSAASFYGIPVTDAARPQVKIHGGTFEGYDADVISVFRFVDVTFDGAVSVSNKAGNRAALSVQDDLLYTTDVKRGSEIKISAGTFEGTAYGAWYACGMDIFTLEDSAEIKGGPTGLQVANSIVGVKANSINISGGTVTGTTNGIYYDYGGGSVNINISGGTIGESTSTQYGIYINKALTVENALKISDNAAISGSTAAVWFHAALNVVHAAVISGGTFEGGDYGIYYGVDGEKANDGLLIEGGTFTGTQYGFYLADNPWSGTIANPTNNVAIIGGTFSATNPNGEAIQGNDGGICTGDVFTEHTDDGRYGYCNTTPSVIDGSVGPGTEDAYGNPTGYSINSINSNSFTLETKTRS